MSSQLSKLMLARGFDLKQNVKDRRDADSNQQLAQLLQQGQINQRQAQTEYYNKQSRGQDLQNTQLAQKMARGPQNTFKQSKGNDGNIYNVEYDPQGNPVNSTRMENMGAAPNKPQTELQQKMSYALGTDFHNMTDAQKTEAYKMVSGPKPRTELEEIRLKNARLDNKAMQAKVGAATTAKEADSRNFYSMMQRASANLNKLTGGTLNEQTGLTEPGYNPANRDDSFVSAIPLFGNAWSSEEKQLATQAQRQWVRAKLRLESGAAIGEKEMENEISTFFPEYGEGEAVIKQKKKSREAAERAMLMGAGPGYQPPPLPGDEESSSDQDVIDAANAIIGN